MLSFYNILEKYLLFFKKACLNIDSSLCGRESITLNGLPVKLENVTSSLESREIQDEFEILKENIRNSDESKKYELISCFADFLQKKTSYKFDVARVIGFFIDPQKIPGNILESFSVEAIHFTATADLQSFFKEEINQALEKSIEDEDNNDKELIFEKFKEAQVFVANLFNYSLHTGLFKKLENVGLGDDILCILEILKKDQHHISLGELNQLKQNLDIANYVFDSRKKDLFSDSLNLELLKSSYEDYRLNVKKSIILHAFSLEKEDGLAVGLIRCEANFVCSSNLANNICGDFKSIAANILENINNKVENNDQSSTLYFYNRLQERQNKESCNKLTFDES
ncbi:hypothetical protein AVI51_16155 (plasmid) [Piscirickettsia salmonis]|uniref:Uncharacterized protein n=2 Tax=Piscirickettsia salmonis TaxID=1238 RepID=A0A9Q6LIL9_PISSA|nr:hypothetical protein [Piscirickettsia salmonis]APS52331.1 hypothetical protein AVI50_15820 [Piscirickettsia salmonis]APS55632.1 hypothetical protein AVI51_16155 [Piscirickettsia salmonis]APS58824.1 hypothetical protein AVI52_16345 [Piscirickettsia salmonis]ERL60844.1 hypothetical protein K661_02833 [Piscirickettsia salmonis LF-89 = ATCC VR-1361]QGN79091.1 hypothetical protein Psal001_03352 [Piscirickettsia salmonis]